MSQALPHISVCICTFKRPELLERVLTDIAKQETRGLFTYSIVVADNDASRSAEATVSQIAATLPIAIKYCVEPRQNIARARNQVVANADGDYIAFIDDDEWPLADWLFLLFQTTEKFNVAGTLGPVKPSFECPPPAWMIRGRFYERPSHPTGYKMHWSETRTGNVLFKKSILPSDELPFRVEYDTGAEDVDFFRRMSNRGNVFVWCDEAVVEETVPASRCTRTYLLRRALLRGTIFAKHPTHRIRNAVKSLVAVPCYTLALPFLALLGQDYFFKYAIKICDHGSRLLAVLGLPLITNRKGIA
jgi:glycosyltransferase involved in cell wall biosynthesis